MAQLTPDDAFDSLGQFHSRLDTHFRQLHDARLALEARAPVFALEHGLSSSDLDALRAGVRRAVAQGFGQRYRQAWLPYVIYAAESGYDYVGGEYWQSFEQSTPGWVQYGDRNRIRMWFRKFNADYGGAIPKGAFAQNFPIIAWPITHAVLPVYLQRYLAQLLYEFRMGLTTELLQNPEELGEHLAARTWGYTERFRIFCANTSLLGQVAAALLYGEDQESPYLLHATLLRLVEGLEQESQAKIWLQAARRAASSVRARGFQPEVPRSSGASTKGRLPNPTDPQLALRAGEDGWRVFAELPDLTTLSERLPHIYEDLRTKRARVEGADQTILARGRLTAPGQEVRLTRWPSPDVPFIELEDGGLTINTLIRDQVQITRGAIWLFKRRSPGSAVEIKSRLVRPGGTYYVVHDGTWKSPEVSWAEPTSLDITAATAMKLTIPERVSEDESAALVAVGLSIASDVAVRPVGVVACTWDGDGAVEWLAGEPGLVGIHAQQVPTGCILTLGGERYTLDWPDDALELFLALQDMPVGVHELHVSLTGSQQQALIEGSLLITIRDPEAPSETAEAGEGIRMWASPTHPTMSELWEPDAITITGPDGLRADLGLTLRSEKGENLASIRQQISLPLLDSDWIGIAKKVRGEEKFIRYFDQAESVELTVSRAGIGHASLTADRGFQPLRWQVIREREGKRARLIDRTDSESTRVELYHVESPLMAIACEVGADVPAPATGGLLRAITGDGVDAVATILLPTQPNELLKTQVTPEIQAGSKTPTQVIKLMTAYQQWAEADLPGDVFARFQRDKVLDAITRTMVSLVCGVRWESIERSMVHADDPLDVIDDMQKAIGESDDQKKVAHTIGRNLHAWLDPASLLTGFAEVMEVMIRSSGITERPSAPRFLLTLAGRSGQIMHWPVVDRDFLLERVLNSPVLLRAARFAMLGTRALSEAAKVRKGF